MIKHVWSVLCTNAVIDRDSNNVSLQNVLEQLKIFSEPQPDTVLPIHFDLVTFWIRKDPNEAITGQSRIRFISPSGRERIVSEPFIDLSKSERSRIKVRFNSIPLEESGRHYFRVELKLDDGWEEVSAIPLTIEFAPTEVNGDLESDNLEVEGT